MSFHSSIVYIPFHTIFVTLTSTLVRHVKGKVQLTNDLKICLANFATLAFSVPNAKELLLSDPNDDVAAAVLE